MLPGHCVTHVPGLNLRSSCRGPASARQPSCLEQRKLEESRLRHAEPAAQLSVRYVGRTQGEDELRHAEC